MAKTIEIVKCLRLKGASVSSSVIVAVARGMILTNDISLLMEKDGFIDLSKNWAEFVLYRVEALGDKLVRRIATTVKIPVSPVFHSETRLDYQRRYKSI